MKIGKILEQALHIRGNLNAQYTHENTFNLNSYQDYTN